MTRVADHALGREDASLQELVAVENLFSWDPFESAVDSSGLLQARRLQIIDRAAYKRLDLREPLAQAWLLSHREIMHRSPFGGIWQVRPEVYWSTYEAFEDGAGAEDLAWAGAQAAFFSDECYTECVLGLLTQSYMQYWVRFPEGREVGEAMARVVPRAVRAAGYCILFSTGFLQFDRERTGILIDELRASLDAVAAGHRDPLLAQLSEIEDDCVNGDVTSLEDERAIPGLVKALGTGYTMVAGALADFGESAAGPVIEAVRADAAVQSVVANGLMALRYMLEDRETRPLTVGTLQEIRSVAELWLTKDQERMFFELQAAIDLAIVLGDPDLRSVVESLASDADEVIARGVNDRLVDLIQRRAAERLAGQPPMPRRRSSRSR